MVRRQGFWTSLGTMVSFYRQHPIAHSYGSARLQILAKTVIYLLADALLWLVPAENSKYK